MPTGGPVSVLSISYLLDMCLCVNSFHICASELQIIMPKPVCPICLCMNLHTSIEYLHQHTIIYTRNLMLRYSRALSHGRWRGERDATTTTRGDGRAEYRINGISHSVGAITHLHTKHREPATIRANENEMIATYNLAHDGRRAHESRVYYESVRRRRQRRRHELK